jgi:type II secretory pathway pseudopilin PulG
MPISFRCPHCGTPMNVADQFAGQTGPCAKCGGTITIPGGQAAGFGVSPQSTQPTYPAAPTYGQPPAYGQAPSYGQAPAYPPTSYPQPAGYGAGGLGAGGAYASRTKSSNGSTFWLVLFGSLAAVAVVCGGFLVALLLPAVQAARDAARRTQSANNMKMIGLGMHNYHDTYNAFPYAGSEDARQGLGLSWRVRMLPFVDDVGLYNSFDWNQPWNGPTNQPLVDRMPKSYQSPSVPESKSQTVYLAVVDSEVVPPGGKPRQTNRPRPIFSQDGRRSAMADIIDGTSNTIMVVEANPEEAVTWTQPRDLVFDPQNPRRGLGKTQRRGFQVLMADGSIRFIDDSVNDEVLRNMMFQNDGNVVPAY